MKVLKIISVGFFAALLGVGLSVYKDYGIPWDAPIQRKLGLESYDYINGVNKKVLTNSDRFYGPAFEILQIYVEKTTGVTTPKQIYETRHLVNFLTFFAGAVVFYLVGKRLTDNEGLALLGAIMLTASPRIFAHAFYNSKDIPFMVTVIFCTYTLFKMIDKPSIRNVSLFGVFAGLSTAVRIMGVLGFVMGIVALLFVGPKKNYRNIRLIILATTTYFLTTIALWPASWPSPFEHLYDSFVKMSNYKNKTSFLYMGETVSSLEAPWHYTLVWASVTTPIFYSLLGLAGFLYGARGLARSWNWKLIITFGWLLVPLVSVIYFSSELYDSWRQMFFIYPAVLLLALYGLQRLLALESRFVKTLLLAGLSLNIAWVGWSMYRWHPHQNVYFSMLAGSPSQIPNNFERDYWGVSYKQGFEYLAKNYLDKKLVITAENFPAIENSKIVGALDQFEVIKGVGGGNFYLRNFRGKTDTTFVGYPEVHNITVNGIKILGVYKVKEPAD
jgi:hypothetical protein